MILENSFDGRRDIVTQFLSPLQRPLYPDNLKFSRGDLTGRFVVLMCCAKAALMAGEHPPEYRDGALLGLCMGASETDQTSGAVLACGQSA